MRHKLFLLLIILLCAFPLHAEQLIGRVIVISDGDTLTILDANERQIKIHLAEIDAPESGQPYGNKAKQELSALTFNKIVIIAVQDVDHYGDIVGRVYVNRVIDVNFELVKRGAAWVYHKYTQDQRLYDLEHEARINKRGLWKLPQSEQVPPWQWRKYTRLIN